MEIRAAALAILMASCPAAARPPQVAVDIPPVHSLVARVMQGIGVPLLILPPGASPHGYAMRPSEAAALANADTVIWTGEALTPWLGRAIGTLSPDAVTLELLDVEGTTLLGFREGAAFEDHRAAEWVQKQGRPGSHDTHDHGHGGLDPHVWLDPQNAQLWLDAIAAVLSRADPDNAAGYARNAVDGRAELDALIGDIEAELKPVRGLHFFVFHDGYHYFEHRFGIAATGALAVGDASPPGPARVAEIRAKIRETNARCVFSEPQVASDLVQTLIEGTGAHTATLDPLGARLTPGPELYPQMLRQLADDLRRCLASAA